MSVLVKLRLMIVILACLLATGCKEVVYSELSEREANDMVAVLAASNVASQRSVDSKGIYSLKVDSAQVAAAIVILKSHGYPTIQFQSLGDIFDAQGIIGTPFEQHVRYIHAMNQELSRTIMEISGVRSARVLVTSPVKGRYDREEPRATASVTINHDPSFNRTENLSQIKLLVSYAMENLAYDDVAVALFAADVLALAPVDVPASNSVLQSSMLGSPGAIVGWMNNGRALITIGFIGLILLAIGTFIARGARRRGPR